MEYQITDKLRQQFQEYTKIAAQAADDLRFLLDHFDVQIDVDFSEESLEKLEMLYWDFRDGKVEWLDGFGTIADFGYLACRYMGQCVCHHTSARWVQTKEKNTRFGQPCLDGFGNAEWDRIYPVNVGVHFAAPEKTSPFFRGARTRTVLAEQLRKAKKIQAKRQQDAPADAKRPRR